MSNEMMIEVLKIAGLVILGGLSLYLKGNKDLQKKIGDITARAVILIREAETMYADVTNAGGDKFNYVVDKLYDMVPSWMSLILTKETIAGIVQRTFDQIETYAKEQLDKASRK